MTIGLLWIWATICTLWAFIVTVMLIHNPLPVPDRGHRAYGVPGEDARRAILQVLSQAGGLRERFTFDAGPTRQTLMWDGYTVLNFLDRSYSGIGRLPGNGISLPVKDPRTAAETAVKLLKDANFTATIQEITDSVVPPNHLVVIESDAFKDWVLVFRRHLLKMPRIEKRKVT